MNQTPHQKNIVHGTINANGNVHIGDIIYNIERDFKSGSILFLRLDKKDETHYTAQLSVKSKHSTQGTLATSGEKWCENITVNIPPQLFDDLAAFQAFRRSIDTQTRYKGIGRPDNHNIQATENKLAQQIFQTFFVGEIGKACADFIQFLEEQRIEELLLAVSADDETIVNLPFEMVLPLLFPPKLGEAKKSLAINNFGLVRTKITSLDSFQMQGNHTTAAPLKMLFITALPENLDERGKMLQIEEEQTRLIQSIGALEATGDKQPKIVIEFLENASLAELDKALKARQHDIVHISGHGAYHPTENKGVLYFENEDGDEEQVSGKALGETLRQHSCVKLLILSACETAIAGSEGGVTEQVAAYGVPSIVAMRFAVTDEGAKVFTTEFYTQLANRLSLTQALAYAREALHKDIMQRREQAPQITHIAEWFTPVVYQNQSVGALIDRTQPYHLPDNFYPLSSFLKTKQSRLIGEGFIGRKRYLIQMRQAFRAGRHVCLHGLGGLGKTTLAEAFAHNYDNHSHATLIFRNGNQINEAHILNTLNKRFAKTNPDLAEQIQQAIDDPQTDVLDKLQLLIDNYLHGRKTILIFDNVEDVQKTEGSEHDYQRSIGSDSLSVFLRHLCENTPPNCHILFTTRYKIENLADVVEHLALDKMGYAEQYRLLNYSQILRGIPLQDRNDVYKRLDGHPRGYEYLEALLKKDKTFNWQQVSKAEADVFENLLLAKVYERLTDNEKLVFKMIAMFIAQTPLSVLEYFYGQESEQKNKSWLKKFFTKIVKETPEVNLLETLQSLEGWSLCFLDKDSRFEVHRLTREWMKSNILGETRIKMGAILIAQFYIRNGKFNISEWELANNYLEIAEEWNLYAGTSFFLQDYYQNIGLYKKAFDLLQSVLAKNIDQTSTLKVLYNLGKIYQFYGEYDNALIHYNNSLSLSIQIQDEKAVGANLNNIGQINQFQGNYDIALGYFEKAILISKKNHWVEQEGATLCNIGNIYLKKGNYKLAKSYLGNSLLIMQQIKDNYGEGIVLSNLGSIALEEEDFQQALNYCEQDLFLCQKHSFKSREGGALNNISQIYSKKGDFETAEKFLKQSLNIRKMLGDIQGEATTLHNLGSNALNKGDTDSALVYLEEALSIRQQTGNIEGLASTLNNIGAIYLDYRSDMENAISYFWKSYSICQKLGSSKTKYPEESLQRIKERIGEAKFQEILSKLG